MAFSLFSLTQASWQSRSIFSLPRSEPRALLSFGIEILRREPAAIGAANTRPIAIRHREPGGIAALALHHHMLAEEPLEAKAETRRGAARAAIAAIAFPFDAAIAQ